MLRSVLFCGRVVQIRHRIVKSSFLDLKVSSCLSSLSFSTDANTDSELKISKTIEKNATTIPENENDDNNVMEQRINDISSRATSTNNPYLRQIIEQGRPYLEEGSKELIKKTNEPLFEPDIASFGPSPAQLSEAKRILETVSDIIDHLVEHKKDVRSRRIFCPVNDDEPIFILDCEVSPNLRLARVLWCLPLNLSNLPELKLERLTMKTQKILDSKFTKKVIQSHVFGRLRNYYPPQIRFVPVPLKDALESFLEM